MPDHVAGVGQVEEQEAGHDRVDGSIGAVCMPAPIPAARSSSTGGRLTFKAMADTTGGALTVIEGTAAPGEGPPPHVHRDQDETLYVLNGRYRV